MYTGFMTSNKVPERILASVLIVIAVGMTIHTPLTLWLGLQVPGYELIIKSWKELLMGVGLVLLIALAMRQNKFNELLSDKLMQISLVYAGLHFLMMAVFQNGLEAAGAGLLIDLRYVLYFVLVYGFIKMYPGYRRLLMVSLMGGAVVVIGFALLQVFVLPKDALAGIGYSKQTISPYLTVDDNHDYIRINSTLRGPNPLGAYVVIVISLLAATAARWKLDRRGWAIIAAGLVASTVVLNSTYSRSSVLAAIATFLVVLFVALSATWKKRAAIAVGVAAIVVSAGLFAARDSLFVQNVILHNNPSTGADIDSNTGHAESLADGVDRMVRQPLGAGIGSTGSASLLSDSSLIIENQYLHIAHEVGWLGLGLFVALFTFIMKDLWRHRQSALALGVFSAGVGLAVIGILLPVWVDDMVSIIWWGLAGVAVAQSLESKKGGRRGARKSN